MGGVSEKREGGEPMNKNSNTTDQKRAVSSTPATSGLTLLRIESREYGEVLVRTLPSGSRIEQLMESKKRGKENRQSINR
jgi:hypothetical protein